MDVPCELDFNLPCGYSNILSAVLGCKPKAQTQGFTLTFRMISFLGAIYPVGLMIEFNSNKDTTLQYFLDLKGLRMKFDCVVT